MTLINKQSDPISSDIPPVPPAHRTPARIKIHAWLQEQAPPLAELHEGAVCLIFESLISGRVRFVAHAVREIRNHLPNYISGEKSGGRLEYKDELDQLSKIWQSSGFSLDEAFLNGRIDTEASPPFSPDISIPRQLFLEIQQLLKKHEAVSVKNKEKAIRFFESCVPENKPIRDTLRPIVAHWWDVTEWFMQKTHDSGKADTACDDQKLRQQFELFESFLETLAQSFYKTTDQLDDILKEANPEQIEKAVPLLIHPQQRSYFFNRLQNPQCIAPSKKNFFKNPPQVIHDSSEGTVSFPIWSESRYLARMAAQEPDAVLQIALKTETDNPSVHKDFVEAVLQMPAEVAVKLVSKVKSWVKSQYSFYISPEKVGALVVHLAKGGKVKEALELARSLLAVKQDSNINNGEANENRVDRLLDDWHYEQILKNYVPELVRVAGELTLKMLVSLLYDAVKFSRHSRESDKQEDNFPIWEDHSRIWQPAIEDHPRNRPHGVRNLLVTALRDAAEQIVESDPAKMRSLVHMLEKWHWRIFHRIALYLIRKFPDAERNLLDERLADPKYLDKSIFQDYEYAFLAKEYFAHLPEMEQQKILGWIENPNIDWFRLEDPEEKALSVRSWQLYKLTPLKDSLPTKWQQRYDLLVNEFGSVELSDIVFAEAGECKWEGIQSPKTDSELDSMSIEELVSFLRIWQPESRGRFDGPSRQGLGSALERLAGKRPEHYALAAEQFKGLHPTYLCSLLWGLRNELNNQKQQGELREFPWSSVLSLCLWLVEESQQIRECSTTDSDPGLDWREARQAVANLLKVGLNAGDDSGIPFNLRSEVWNTIRPLTQDPDPTPEYETRYGGSNMNPSDFSINTVRGEAMHTLVRYALWIRRHFEQMADGGELIRRGFDEMPEVRQVLNEHLNPDQEPSLAIRSVYGQWFPWLTSLDPAWATQSVAKIFPQDETLSKLRRAAWETYITSYPVYDNVFDVLVEEYSYTVEQINVVESEKENIGDPNKHLAQYLMTLYYRGKLDFNKPEGLLALFYEKAPDALRGEALEFVGRSLCDTNEVIEPQILNQLQFLWEQRLKAARTATPPASHATELAAFGWWFASEKFDDSWAIEQLRDVLERVGKVEPDHLVIKRLAALADAMPVLAVECLRLIIEGDKKGWGIYGWSDEAKIILITALQGSNDEAKQTSEALIHRLGERGYWDFRELLPAGNK